LDWRGLNVIFEYQNVQNTRCSTRENAHQWLNLSESTYSFGTAGLNNPYKTALQAITDQVTLANAAPDRTNGSALGRIRTNENVFAPFLNAPSSELAWEKQDWEFRQLELDRNTHSLALTPLTNNPPHTANHASNIEEDYSATNPPVTNVELLDWGTMQTEAGF